MVGVGVPGETGLKVTSRPRLSTPVHWLLDGHAMPFSPSLSTVVGVGLPGEVGLNVASRPKPSAAVHWLGDGHETPTMMPS